MEDKKELAVKHVDVNGVEITSYPEGWEKAKSLLTHIPEDEREGYLFQFAFCVMVN